MPPIKLTVALVGEQGAGVKALRLFVNRGHRVVSVFTDSRAGGSAASVASLAESLDVSVRPAPEVREPALASRLRAQDVDLLLSVHSPYIVHASVLEAPTLGAYNLHPGPLPECAGLHPTSWALYGGAHSHAVTLHRMTPTVDAGPIAFSESFDLQPTDTGLSVLMQCVRRGLGLIERLLDLAERGGPIPGQPQNLAARRWFGRGPPEDGRIDWHRPAHRIVDFVRACDYRPFRSPWGFPRCIADGVEVGILAARVVQGETRAVPGTVSHTEGGAVLIAATDALVRVEEVEIDGQQLPAAEAFCNVARLELAGDKPRPQTAP